MTREERFQALVKEFLAGNFEVIAELEAMDDLITPEIRKELTGGLIGN